MDRPIIDFILDGAVGQLELGISRDEVLKRLGWPNQWLGKAPTIGPVISTPQQAEVWFYYNDTVGIRFDPTGLATAVHVCLPKIERQQFPFQGWPIRTGATMADLRNFLQRNAVPFREEEDAVVPHHILAENRCLALCSVFERGALLPRDVRPITIIETFAKADDLPPFVTKWSSRANKT